MQKLKLKRFNKPQFLKRIGRGLLTEFFNRFPSAGPHSAFALPPPELPDADYYYALAGRLLHPEQFPPSLVEDLSAIEEMASPEGLARLESSPEWARLQPALRSNSTAEEISMQVWLAAPDILAREHNFVRLRRLTAFEHAAHVPTARPSPGAASHELPNTLVLSRTTSPSNVAAPESEQHKSGPLGGLVERTQLDSCPSGSDTGRGAGAAFSPPDPVTLLNLTLALDAWFVRNLRGAESTRIEVYPMDGDYWFLIRHGDLFNRVSKVDRQQTEILHFRPERDDVVVYSPRLHELRVNARTKAERDLYIEQFGLHLHGDPGHFSERYPYTLEPLRTAGRDALAIEGLPGISDIRLCKVSIRLNNRHNEVITREADDLFRCPPLSPSQPGPLLSEGTLERALFEIQFTGSLKSQPVEIRVPNVLKLGRGCDAAAVQNWLCRSGFRRPLDTAPYPAYIIHQGPNEH